MIRKLTSEAYFLFLVVTSVVNFILLSFYTIVWLVERQLGTLFLCWALAALSFVFLLSLAVSALLTIGYRVGSLTFMKLMRVDEGQEPPSVGIVVGLAYGAWLFSATTATVLFDVDSLMSLFILGIVTACVTLLIYGVYIRIQRYRNVID